MSVLVKGYRKPQTCGACAFFHRWNRDGADESFCPLAVKKTKTNNSPKWCPIIEIPPHGRLIDADALIKDGWKLHKEVIRMGGYVIHEKPLNYPDIPPIIEAEEAEK